MDISQFSYSYPDELIATHKTNPSRVMFVDSFGAAVELNKEQLLSQFQPGEVLVINDTKVEKRRIHTACGLEILFIQELPDNHWQVLCPARKIKSGQVVELPGAVSMSLVERGLPQTIKLSQIITPDYFNEYGQMALPPYIQKQRGVRGNEPADEQSYQTDWAKNEGSCAAPTASLHFSSSDIENLTQYGVQVCRVTLHVGLGTFLPIKVKNILEHEMHKETVYISKQTQEAIIKAQSDQKHIWALGTTATRAIESIGKGILQSSKNGSLYGDTDLFLYPGKKFNYVTRLMTNFHQPESTLLALVSAFAGAEKVKKSYSWAIEKKFKLFSYGDLSVWDRG